MNDLISVETDNKNPYGKRWNREQVGSIEEEMKCLKEAETERLARAPAGIKKALRELNKCKWHMMKRSNQEFLSEGQSKVRILYGHGGEKRCSPQAFECGTGHACDGVDRRFVNNLMKGVLSIPTSRESRSILQIIEFALPFGSQLLQAGNRYTCVLKATRLKREVYKDRVQSKFSTIGRGLLLKGSKTIWAIACERV